MLVIVNECCSTSSEYSAFKVKHQISTMGMVGHFWSACYKIISAVLGASHPRFGRLGVTAQETWRMIGVDLGGVLSECQ